jgi:predicted DNA-binding protein YlxM (UPF0122 family)
MFEKNLKIGYLLDFYGDILPDRKREVLDFYYNDDLSLAEIADDIGISRQGVRDIIKKAEEQLLFYEEKLGLAARFTAAQKSAEELVELTGKLELGDEVKEKINSLLEAINSK